MSKGKVALGAVIGAVAGVVAGILTAPKSGKETRSDIKGKAAELKKEAVNRTDDMKVKSAKVIDDVKGKAEDYKERGEHAARDAKKGLFSRKDK